MADQRRRRARTAAALARTDREGIELVRWTEENHNHAVPSQPESGRYPPPGLRPHTTGLPRAGRRRYVVLYESAPRQPPVSLAAWLVLAAFALATAACVVVAIYLLTR